MKRNFKGILSLLLAAVMIFSSVAIGVTNTDFGALFTQKAEAAETSGTCGENLTWTFDGETGTLTISGTGEMTNWSSLSSVPWYSIKSDIQKIIISTGVTSIGVAAFEYCYHLASIIIPDSVTKIGNYAFYYCLAMEYIHMPSSVNTIGNNVIVSDDKKEETIGTLKFDLRNPSDENAEMYAQLGITYEVVESWKSTTAICSSSEESVAKIYADTYGHKFILCNGHSSTGNEHTHSYASEITTPATCTENGVMTYTCTECGDVYTESIPALGHNAGEWEIVTNSSCTAVGEKVKKCTVCGEILESEEIAMTEHIAGEWEITSNANCIENGEKVKKCINCAEILETEVIPATGHNQGSWIISIEPTCTEEGEKVANCTVCGVVVANDVVPATGHTAGAWETVLEPTTETEGKKVKKCNVCGVTLEEAAIAKLPKEPVKDNAVVKSPSTTTISYGDAIILHVDESK
ncbi:MAG: leucine-rich repeat domain-containing protein, partial [Clostridia bacterium]|nr:leucine-rich repeat domain-containing protein [Clostridia bacterium]